MGESRDTDKPLVKCTFYDWAKDFWGVMDFCIKYHKENFSQPKVAMEISAVGNSIGAYLMMTVPSDLAPYFTRGFMLSGECDVKCFRLNPNNIVDTNLSLFQMIDHLNGCNYHMHVIFQNLFD